MSLKNQLAEYVQACFSGLWIETQEPAEALLEIDEVCRREAWQRISWNLASGYLALEPVAGLESMSTDPLSAVRALPNVHRPGGTTLLVLENFHRFLQSAETVQTIASQIALGKTQRMILVILSPQLNLPPELEKLFVVIEHELPSRDQLLEIARGIGTHAGELPENGADLNRILDAASGLTRCEAEGAYSLAIVRYGRIEASTIWELKSQMLKKSGLLALHRGSERFDRLGGLGNLKAFCLRALRESAAQGTRARGILLLSPPGCGKSQFAKALGQETGRPTLTLDLGSLLGSLVGQSEQNIRKALRVADAMQPCILFCDEIEKALSGAATGAGDSGVTARLFGTLLTWLNDHTSDVFFVGTCNDISRIPPEFARAERFDGVFLVDLPDRQQRDLIWQIYLAEYGLEPSQRRPKDDNWTGAEIKACCRLARLLDVPLIQASQNVVPVAVTAAESIDRLRQWASGRCLSADRPGIYQASSRLEARDGRTRRAVKRSLSSSDDRAENSSASEN